SFLQNERKYEIQKRGNSKVNKCTKAKWINRPVEYPFLRMCLYETRTNRIGVRFPAGNIGTHDVVNCILYDVPTVDCGKRSG
ncbi:MAG: hypothetical protein ACE5DQ_00450, partial [Candidatus Paceibacterota bacterium]